MTTKCVHVHCMQSTVAVLVSVMLSKSILQALVPRNTSMAVVVQRTHHVGVVPSPLALPDGTEQTDSSYAVPRQAGTHVYTYTVIFVRNLLWTTHEVGVLYLEACDLVQWPETTACPHRGN